MYKCCRWCGNFDDGACHANVFTDSFEINMDKIRDDGLINEVLKEQLFFNSDDIEKYYELAKELKISKVKAEKLLLFLGKALQNINDDIEDALDTALMNNIVSAERVYIKNEHEFVCSEFK